MNQRRWLGMTAGVCLWLAAPFTQAAEPSGSVVRTHLKYANRSSLAQPSLRSTAALVLDTTHSSVLYSRRSDIAMPIASITKLMTALVVTDAGQSLDEVLVVSDDDRSLGKGAASRLAPGTHLSRGDLMHLALMASENRAAHALGRNYPGGVAACVIAMNAKARELGMTSAHFVEPTGLSDENVASAEDLSKLVMAAAKVPAIREYSTDSDYVVPVVRAAGAVPQHRLAGEQAGLEHRRAEDRLHLPGRSLPRDADGDRGAHRRDRAAEFLWQAHPRG